MRAGYAAPLLVGTLHVAAAATGSNWWQVRERHGQG